jgi:hypothetical protein
VNIRVLLLAMGGLAVAAALVVLLLMRTADEPAPAEERVAEPAVSEPAAAPPVVAEAPAAPPTVAPAPAAPPVAAPAAPAPAAAPTRTTLRIDADVPGAQVFLDRQFMGTTPLTLDDLQPGRRQLNVSAEGFDGVARTIELEPGAQDISVSLREVRLNAAVNVVHRHRIGSCRGRLVADVNGVRYETDHQDAFQASLGDLEVFEIDYLDNNLRIRLRNGRQYNFTDPDGDADRIFVFHRDVERAREQLAR